MMKKICVVTTKSITLKAFLIDQLEFLSINGYEVTVICDADKELIQILPNSIIYKPIAMNRGIDFWGMLKSIYIMYKLFKSEKFNIVQFSTPNAAFYTSIASWLAKIPVRLYCQWGIRYVGYKGLKRQLLKFIEKITCSLSTDIEPDSKSNLEFGRKEGLFPTHKSRVIWNGSANGVDLTKFNINERGKWRKQIREFYEIDSDNFVFGYIGRIDRDKGINELLLAFKKIQKDYKEKVKLLIVGPDDKSFGIDEELFEWSKKCEDVIYCGFSNEVEKYYSAMDVFILPSYREGFGSVVIEAEAMGTPVIVTDIPGPIDAMVKGETGLVVQKGDIKSLVESMNQLYSDPKLRFRMGESAVEFSTNKFEQKKLWKHVLVDRNNLIQKSGTINLGEYKKNAQS